MQLIDCVKKICGLSDDQQLAEMLGKDKSTISKWRSGGIPAKAERELKKILAEKQGTAEPEIQYSSTRDQSKTKNADQSPIVAHLISVTDQLTPEHQGELLQKAIALLIAEQTKVKE